MEIIMSLKHGLLGLINYGCRTGYDLNKAFKESLNFFWQSQTSQIYRELSAMEKSGWLTSEIVIQTDKPNKKVYSITPAGKEKLMQWLSQDSIDEELSYRSAFLMKVFFLGERNVEDNIQILKRYRLRCQAALSSLDAANGTIDQYSSRIDDRRKAFYWQATENYGRYYYTMCIAWADDTIKKMENLK